MDTDTIKIEAAHARNDDPATLIESIDNTAKMDDGEEDAVSVHADEADETDDQQIILLRDPNERPVFKLSVKLLDTYKYINKVYYESKARRLREQKESSRGGVHNDGFDDQNYDYILQGDEILKDRYILKHRMGKVSFYLQFLLLWHDQHFSQFLSTRAHLVK
jgi:hypothetical protein